MSNGWKNIIQSEKQGEGVYLSILCAFHEIGNENLRWFIAAEQITQFFSAWL